MRAGVLLDEGEELVPFLLGAVGAADEDEAPLLELVFFEGLGDGRGRFFAVGGMHGFL
jgi:hypothetical protein